MFGLMNLVYTLTSIYLLFMVGSLLWECLRRTRKDAIAAFKNSGSPKLLLIASLGMLMLIPARFYFMLYLPCIPDGDYEVNIEVRNTQYTANFAQTADISVYTYEEYPDDNYVNEDNMRGGNLSSGETNKVYLLEGIHWTSGKYVYFNAEVYSGETSQLEGISSSGLTSEYYEIRLPEFTSEKLGVSHTEKLDYLNYHIYESGFALILAVIGLFFCFARHRQERILSAKSKEDIDFINEYMFLIVSSLAATIAGLAGTVAFFYDYHIFTIVCAGITIVDSVAQVLIGEQRSLTTEMFTIGIGMIVAMAFSLPLIVSIALCLCIATIGAWLLGIVVLFFISSSTKSL